MGLGVLGTLRSWRPRLRWLAEVIGLADELAPVPDGQLVTRPFRLVVVLWLLWGWYAVVKLYHGWENLPANWPGLYALLLGASYLLWRLSRDPDIQKKLLLCLKDFPSREAAANHGRHRTTSSTWLGAGFLLVACNLALLEWRHPYTFTHDDNLSQFLPVVLHGMRAFFDEGIFPTWNPHQFAGAPTASLGTYALTYPPTYASFAIARWLLGNEYATFEVFGVLHLLAGYCAMFWGARTIGLRPALASAAGCCFALCGFFLVGGRSWYYMLPLAAWLPLLAIAIWNLAHGKPGWIWVLSTGVLLGVLFHAGNAQMWVYAVTFLGLAALYLVYYGKHPWQILAPVACATGLGLAIAAPLFLPQYLETAELKRFAGGEPIVRGLFGLFAPWPVSFADRPGMAETSNIRFTTQFYYAGTVFTIAAAIGLFSCLWHRWPQQIALHNVLLVMALVAFVYALGRVGMAWGITGELPVFKQFRHPMKFLAFLHLFGILGGGLILERLLRRFPQPRLEWLIAGACAVLVSYHTFLALPAFFSWSIRPYPRAPHWLASLGNEPTQRIYPIGPRRSTATNYELSQMVHLPTVYGTLSLTGYDPLIEENRQHTALRERLHSDPLATLRAYGVRYLVVYPTQDLPKMPRGHNYFRWYYWEPPERAAYHVQSVAGRLVHWTAGAALYEIDGAAPLAFVEREPSRPLTIRFDAAGGDILLPANHGGDPIVVNVIPPRFLRAYADGQSIATETDDWGRLRLAPPSGTRAIRISYSPPWLAGSLLGLVLAGGSCLGLIIVRRKWPEPLASEG